MALSAGWNNVFNDMISHIKMFRVLMKVRANGLCTNDLRDYLGDMKYTYPRIGGHEFSGEVVEIGSDVNPEHFDVGDHVVKYIIPANNRANHWYKGHLL
jgi:threonine dehydrogenase-like Zn-dependent dehydrogenase